ncbi:unnamed protein product [Lasius platythorax]|uniref:Uncharacterized protein n=1 Tax=Lasius platythorax TaxID=488582 RepID=A0AAV2NUR7_9HYME
MRAENEWSARETVPRELVMRPMRMRRCGLAVGPPCSKPARGEGSRDNVSLEFTIGPVFLVTVWFFLATTTLAAGPPVPPDRRGERVRGTVSRRDRRETYADEEQLRFSPTNDKKARTSLQINK